MIGHMCIKGCSVRFFGRRNLCPTGGPRLPRTVTSDESLIKCLNASKRTQAGSKQDSFLKATCLAYPQIFHLLVSVVSSSLHVKFYPKRSQNRY